MPKLKKRKKKPVRKAVLVRMTPSLYEDLTSWAEEVGLSREGWIRRCIEERRGRVPDMGVQTNRATMRRGGGWNHTAMSNRTR